MALSAKKTVLVLHRAAQIPLAGIAWQALHYVLGLRRLGYDVWYVEDSGASPYDPSRFRAAADCTYNVAFLKSMMDRYGLGDRWAYWDFARDEVHGVSRERLSQLYSDAAALINLSGTASLRDEHRPIPIRAYIDTDPGFEQMRVADGDAETIRGLEAHTHHLTYGENLGSGDCPIPVTRFDWKKTRPPVLVDLWDAGCVKPGSFFTSISTWETSGKDIIVGGETYRWSKHVNFLRFLDLPRQVMQPLRLAIIAPGEDVGARIRDGGWDLLDAVPISADMQAYRNFIVDSRGEFTVAKDIYVRPKTGWFSDRSACYLAAGRPVITQDTGFSKTIETGRGLFAFSTLDEVREALREINGDYARHSIGAIEVAYEYFDADAVLRRLVADISL